MTATNPPLPERPESQAQTPIAQQPLPQQPTGYAQWPGSYGQAYQPYSQYAVQSQPADVEAGQQQQQQQHQHQQNWSYGPGLQGLMTVTLPEENKSWTFTKMGAWALNVIIAIIVLGLTIPLANRAEWGVVVVMLCPIPAAALLWSASELITRALRKFKQGIHPGAHVGLHLLIWLASSVVGGIFVGASALVDPSDEGMYCTSYSTINDGPRMYSDCYDPFGGRKDVFVALSAFYVILAVLNLYLFIVACIDTSKRNRALRNRPVMVIQNPAAYWGGWQPMPQGNVPMNAYPQQQQQQQQQQQPQPEAAPQTTAERTGPVQDGVSQPSTPGATAPMEHPPQQMSEKGKGPENPHAIHEFYTPSG